MSETAISRLMMSSPFSVRTLLIDVRVVEIAGGVEIDLEMLRCGRARQAAALVLRPFDLDNFGAEGAQPARCPGTRPDPAKIDNPGTCQRLHLYRPTCTAYTFVILSLVREESAMRTAQPLSSARIGSKYSAKRLGFSANGKCPIP